MICKNGKQIWKDEKGSKFLSYEEAKNHAESNEIDYVKIISGLEKNVALQRTISNLHKKSGFKFGNK